MKAVLLCRVSSRDQELSGYSLPAQEKLLSQYAENKGLKVDKVYAISESASGSSTRKTFNEMMSYIQKEKVGCIIAEKVDRLTRELKTAVAMNEWLEGDDGRQLHLVKDSLILHKNSRSQEKLNWGLRVILAKNYTDNLSEEVRKGWQEKISQGWYPGHAKFGYRSVDEGRRKVIEVDPVTAQWVVKMFEAYGSGEYSLKSLEQKLFAEGLRTMRGKKVSDTNIRTYLSDKFYIGKFDWCGVTYEGKHRPIISRSTFEFVQARLAGKKPPKHSKHEHLFGGTFMCGYCQGTISWEAHKGFKYGHCNHHRECPSKKWAREDEVDEVVATIFGRLVVSSPRLQAWLSRSLKEVHREDEDTRTSDLVILNKRHDQVCAMIDRLYDDKLEGLIDRDMYDRKFKQLAEEKEGLASSIHEKSTMGTEATARAAEVFDIFQQGELIYRKSNVATKRKMVRTVFEVLEIRDKQVSVRFRPEFEVLAKAVLHTNGSKVEDLEPCRDNIFELDKVGSYKKEIGTLVPTYSSWRE